MEAKKIKIQIKSILGNVLFEYECENNTIKRTLEEAVNCGANLRSADLCSANLRSADLCDADLRDADLRSADLCDADLRDADLRDANLRGADLRDANLCGADLRDADLCGSVINYDDNPCGYGHGNTEALVTAIESNSNLKLTEVYENHDAYPSRWSMFWKNLIIIRKWEVVENKTKVDVELTDLQKDAIRAFAKLHGVSKLAYYCVDKRRCRFITTVDGNVHGITLAGTMAGLEDGSEYSLADLGIEAEEA